MLQLHDDLDDPTRPSIEMKKWTDRILDALYNEKSRRRTYLEVASKARHKLRTKNKRGQRETRAVTYAEYRLLFALVSYASPDLGDSFPTRARVAEDWGYSTGNLEALLRRLVNKGWLVRHSLEGQGSRVNQFCVPGGAISPYAKGWEGPVRTRPKVW